jgi:hypothetical protein
MKTLFVILRRQLSAAEGSERAAHCIALFAMPKARLARFLSNPIAFSQNTRVWETGQDAKFLFGIRLWDYDSSCTSDRAKSLTTKDTKVHEGIRSFVFLRGLCG